MTTILLAGSKVKNYRGNCRPLDHFLSFDVLLISEIANRNQRTTHIEHCPQSYQNQLSTMELAFSGAALGAAVGAVTGCTTEAITSAQTNGSDAICIVSSALAGASLGSWTGAVAGGVVGYVLGHDPKGNRETSDPPDILV